MNGGDDRPMTIGAARLRCGRPNDGHHCKRFGKSLYSALISKLHAVWSIRVLNIRASTRIWQKNKSNLRVYPVLKLIS